MKRRRLADLYVTGREVTINDGGGEPVVVWVSKLNDVDHESVLRRSNAAKARFIMDGRDENSETYQSVWANVVDYQDREGLIALIIADEVIKYRRRVEAEVGADEETWGNDGYLQGLVDSWLGDGDNEGLMHVHIEHPDDPEANRVLEELNKFNEQVNERLRAESDRLESEWENVGEEELWRQATHKLVERRGDDAFTKEYERQRLFYSVREPDDHRKKYFGTLAEVDDLDERIRRQLVWAYNEMIVEPEEGKDSPANPGSSNSSESPDAEATPEPSGPVAVSA